jgi:hypothetical protein
VLVDRYGRRRRAIDQLVDRHVNPGVDRVTRALHVGGKRRWYVSVKTFEVSPLDHVSDADFLACVRRAVADERQATAQLIALLKELDARRLYLAEGCSSLFTYCTQVLRLTEHAAYGRIEAARAARKFPVILSRRHDGTLSLTAVGLLAPHLTDENHLQVRNAARHKTKRDVEQLVPHSFQAGRRAGATQAARANACCNACGAAGHGRAPGVDRRRRCRAGEGIVTLPR